MSWPWPARAQRYVPSPPRIKEAELPGAFLVEDDNTLWRAVQQLIDDEIRDALDAAEQSVGNHGICASEIGGVQHLRRLRDRMLELRRQARSERDGDTE